MSRTPALLNAQETTTICIQVASRHMHTCSKELEAVTAAKLLLLQDTCLAAWVLLLLLQSEHSLRKVYCTGISHESHKRPKAPHNPDKASPEQHGKNKHTVAQQHTTTQNTKKLRRPTTTKGEQESSCSCTTHQHAL
jgi:hypothetical protein